MKGFPYKPLIHRPAGLVPFRFEKSEAIKRINYKKKKSSDFSWWLPTFRWTYYKFVCYGKHFLPLGIPRSGRELIVLIKPWWIYNQEKLGIGFFLKSRYIQICCQIYSPSDYCKFSLFFFRNDLLFSV